MLSVLSSQVEHLTVLQDNLLASSSNNEINIWNITDGSIFRALTGHHFTSLAVLNDGLLASGSLDVEIN